MRRNSATDDVRGSLAVDAVEPLNEDGGDELDDGLTVVPLLVTDNRLDASEEIVAAAAADDVIVGQHEHNPGNATKTKRRQ